MYWNYLFSHNLENIMKNWKLTLQLLAGLVCGSAAAIPPCDGKLKADSNLTGYTVREKGVRCEGFYIAKVSKNPRDLALVGLTRGDLDFDSGSRVVLRSSLPGRTISIRGVGMAEKTYYRLDGIIRRGHPFYWQLDDVVKKRKLRANDIGLSGFYESQGRDEQIFVPIDVGVGEKIRVKIIGSELFVEAYWRHSSLTDGKCGAMAEWSEIKPPAYESRPLELILSGTIGPELCMEVSARPTKGSGWRTGRWKIKSGQ